MDILGRTDAGPQVLIVEDDPVSAKVIQRMFQNHGIDTDRAVDGSEAILLHERNHYRLVVSDWMMPGINGIDLCKAFRAQDGPYVYFILCSAKGNRDDRVAAYEAGVDDFLTKPLDQEELWGRLYCARRILLSEHKLQEQNQELEIYAQKTTDANSSLQIASKRFEGLFNGLPVACFTFDAEGLVHEWNRGATQIFGIEAYRGFQKPIWKVLGESGIETWKPEIVSKIFSGQHAPSFDWVYQDERKPKRFLTCNIICLYDNRGTPVGAVCANIDVTERTLAEQQIARQMVQINEYTDQLHEQKRELEEMNVRLNYLAVTDGLTGLWNHRRFQEMLEDSLNDLTRHNEKFSLILLDIDHFKKFNDHFGHQAGDEVLQMFSDTLRSAARATEMPARYGGEEFAIILQRCDEVNALVAAQRFHSAIRDQSWPYRSVTASLGLTTCDDPRTTAKTLVARADAALYHAKQSGRNQIVTYNDMMSLSAA